MSRERVETTICTSIGYSANKRKRLMQYMRKKSILLVLDRVDSKLVSSKKFGAFCKYCWIKQGYMFTSNSRIGLTNDEQCYTGPLSIEDEGRLFSCSPYQRREWLGKRKTPNEIVGQCVHSICRVTLARS